jgi:hypothetical protein
MANAGDMPVQLSKPMSVVGDADGTRTDSAAKCVSRTRAESCRVVCAVNAATDAATDSDADADDSDDNVDVVRALTGACAVLLAGPWR